MSATILNRLNDSVDHGWLDWLNATSMLAGCSTGSIITSELLAGMSPPQIIELFKTSEVKFYDSMNDSPDQPAYSIDAVLKFQKALHQETTVADATRNVLFVSFNVGGLDTDDARVVPRPWDTISFTNMLGTEQDRLDGLDGHADTPIAVAATSSGAMPGQLGSLDGNVDGAFFNHDPTLAAIALAVRNGWSLDNIVAITIGTGLMHDWIADDTSNWGARQWMDGTSNPFNNTPPFLMNQSRPSPMLDMCLNGTSDEVAPRLAKMLLGDRYVNLNPRLPCFIPENSTNEQALALLEHHGATVDISKAVELITNYWPNCYRGLVSKRTPTPTAATKRPAQAPRATPGIGESYYIKRFGSDDVLDVCDYKDQAGTKVIVYPRKPSGLNQLWRFIPAEDEPGWWYLQTAMDTKLVLTLQDTHPVMLNPPIIVDDMRADLKQRQLWTLVPTYELGWWYLQSKYQGVGNSNPSSLTPTVIGTAENGATRDAVGVALDYPGYSTMAWGFIRLPDTGTT